MVPGDGYVAMDSPRIALRGSRKWLSPRSGYLIELRPKRVAGHKTRAKSVDSARLVYTAIRSLIPSFGAWTRSCLVPRYRSVVCTEAWPNRSWICSSSPPAARHIFAHDLLRSWGAIPGTPAALA
jgi:hypothetical protein